MERQRLTLRKSLTLGQLGPFFGAVSEALDGRSELNDIAVPRTIESIKLHLHARPGGYDLKMEINEPDPGEAARTIPGSGPFPGVEGLRKSVRLDMSILTWFVSESRLPATHELEAIYARMDAFVAMADLAADRLQALKYAAQDVKDAVAARDLCELKTAVQRFIELKKK